MEIFEEKHLISDKAIIEDCLVKINELHSEVLIIFVVDKDGRVTGSITDGDIRRGYLNGANPKNSVTKIMRKDFKYINNISEYEKINSYINLDLKIVPLVTKDFKLLKLINLTKLKAVVPVSAVIMAGGKGIRLKPYTNDIPKPMLELSGKPIIAHNIDRLIAYGIQNIYVSVNHLKEQIIDYINNNYAEYNIKFIQEDKPLGTIGSLSLVKNWENDDILVMNADVLSNIDFYDFFINYKNHNDDINVATFNIRINIPYGILDTTDKKINSLIEKPSFTYYSNAGIYLIKKEILKYIPNNESADSTELMEILIQKGKNVSHFPIRGYWLDIGNVQNYAKAQDDIKYIKF